MKRYGKSAASLLSGITLFYGGGGSSPSIEHTLKKTPATRTTHTHTAHLAAFHLLFIHFLLSKFEYIWYQHQDKYNKFIKKGKGFSIIFFVTIHVRGEAAATSLPIPSLQPRCVFRQGKMPGDLRLPTFSGRKGGGEKNRKGALEEQKDIAKAGTMKLRTPMPEEPDGNRDWLNVIKHRPFYW
jgi:hypothetical protein